ncbi:Rieske (2Fe-2S) protein [Nonomuraea longicatena]|uniref:Cytochrome bc1 complex Rieske iron-sulfur subunit n=1 Tax=Nonomuraea longicatena TaxID=83682 RepID=A0ABP3ZDV5_9ACTN
MSGAEAGFGVPGVGRRQVLGAAGVAACGLALAGCGTGEAAAPGTGAKGQVLVKAAEVPVGGGKIVKRWKLVVTQPSAGVYKAFSTACPHQGCAVGVPEDGVMTCPCHGSEFDATTGAALKGPAKAPLASVEVRLDGDGIVAV